MPKDEPDQAPLPAGVLREKQINIRIDADLLDAATEKAAPYGLAPVIRAFLRAFARGAVEIPKGDFMIELLSAPRGRPARRKPRKPAKE